MEKSRKKKKYVDLVLIKNPFIRRFFFLIKGHARSKKEIF